MKVTIDCENDLDAALQHHLDSGVPVQQYVKAALRFYRDARIMEAQNKSVGFGDKARFSTYNTVMDTETYLKGQDE